ncbi:uncharacterized protein N7496_006427 [Penicillium cataractarum]|uniref:Zn(2)-C6 fungal-type domain-containing protein n=1 Tax=Penicillium cataractarum TaxID=2100454 RepID=A0A9W9S2W7_9EURO|nr:uncharacterized protein N7496_006427 [Penicillium cataractarum]KAJ5370335.1 hypothetical protein N7496_006427 [Penicillium cataractarum]
MRHVKCDGKRPSCARCAEYGKQCNYAESRRGGLNRAALAERRKRLAATKTTIIDELSPEGRLTIQQMPGSPRQYLASASSSYSPLEDISVGEGRPSENFPAAPQVHIGDIKEDPLVDSYYEHFHRLHPFVPPRRHFARLCEDLRRQNNFTPLIAVMRLIGHIFNSCEWSIPLKDYVETCLSKTTADDPVMVQCRLLYSMALFWYDYKAEAKAEIDHATHSATDMQMFLRDFSTKHGGDDPVLQECWRRTWWMLYIVNGYYTGTLGTMNFAVANIDATVDLPCEESEYESGHIPAPRNLQEFDCREFTQEETFSSFAYLVGAAADSCLDGWRLLLPKKQKQVMKKTGEIDELMFQANMIIHVATIGIHRPLSDLKFNVSEDISSCARKPPLDTLKPDLVNIHTVRVLRSVEAQIRLLALPIRKFHHTPFATCMVSQGALALLSACNLLFEDRDLATARDQIRMTIGCLKALGDTWPRAARNVREIQAIARHMLGIQPSVASGTPSPNAVPPPDEGPRERSQDSDYDFRNDLDTLPFMHSIEDLCGWDILEDVAGTRNFDRTQGYNQ